MIGNELSGELRRCELFSEFAPDSLSRLVDEVELLGVAGGRTVFRSGEEADGLYVVLRGRLRSIAEGGRVLGDVAAGGYVGEMALLSGATRSATVVAVRDTTMARLSRRGFEQLVAVCPSAALALARTVALRAQSNLSRAMSAEGFSTIALVSDASAGGGAAAETLEKALIAELAGAGLGRVAEVRADMRPFAGGEAMDADDAAWFDAVEADHRFVVYRSASASQAWTRLCLRRADLVLVLACARTLERESAEPPAIESGTLAPTDLVLVHDGEIRAGTAARARASGRYRRVFHARRGVAADVRRIVRLLTGRGVGLALSGGGRRGAAHVGVLRALAESGVEVDMVAGTSAGAIVGAMAAMQIPWPDALERVRRLGRMRAWRDVGPPLVALLSGRSLGSLLREAFAELAVDDLPLPFLAVSSAVDSGELFVPDGGPLWLAVRASSSLPGVFPPVPWRSRLLMDGALLNNLPADLLRSRCPDGTVIASNVGLPSVRSDVRADLHSLSGWSLLGAALRSKVQSEYRPGLVELLVNAACASSTRQLADVRDRIDVYIAPKVDDYAMLPRRGAKDIDVLAERGYRAALEKLEKLGTGTN